MLTQDQLDALRRFAVANGRYWKYQLRIVWIREPQGPDGALLRQVRNDFGPAWLKKFKL